MEVDCDEGPVNREIVEKFAESMGVKFPESYVDFISKHDGAFLIKDTFAFEIYGEPNENSFYFLKYEGSTTYSRIDGCQDHGGYGHDNVITFGETPNGDFICFDYRTDPKGNNPSIVYMVHDDSEEDSEKMPIIKLADA